MPVTQYKKVEKEFADRIGSWLRRIWLSLGTFFRYIMVKGKQRFTVMLIPHSEKKIFNFQISFFTLIFITATFGVILVGFFLLATNYTYINEQNVVLAQEKNTNEKDMTNLKDQIADLRTAMKHWQASMDSVIAAIESQDKAPSSGTGLVATSFLAPPEDSAAGSGMTTRELSDLRTMTRQLKNALTPLEEISKTLSAYKDLMANTPTYWPLKGAHGQITTPFGWTTEPFTKVGYMHTGVDISTGVVGTPVVATADGKVTQRGETAQLGYNITIQHKYGFYTRYGHLSGFAGRQKGDDVHRGDVIGYLGNTGLSTGPHLHYEVRLGAMYIDPMQYLLNMPANAPAVASRRIVD